MSARAFLLLAIVPLAIAVPNLMLFYEALCPRCVQEMQISIPQVLSKFGDSVFISLVPFGNAVAKLEGNGSLRVECQHGENECTANLWHACSHAFMLPRERVDYAVCTMSRGSKKTMSLLRKCTSKKKAALLERCAGGEMGVSMIKLMADITAIAGPVADNKTRHIDGVPTFFIDGFPVTAADMKKYKLADLVCLKAKDKPDNCE